MVETVIIDRNKPDNDPAVFVGEWCFSVVGLIEDENIPEGKTAVSVYGNTDSVGLMLDIGHGIREMILDMDANGRGDRDTLLYILFMELMRLKDDSENPIPF